MMSVEMDNSESIERMHGTAEYSNTASVSLVLFSSLYVTEQLALRLERASVAISMDDSE